MFDNRYIITSKIDRDGKISYKPVKEWRNLTPEKSQSGAFEGVNCPSTGSVAIMTGWGLLGIDVDSGKVDGAWDLWLMLKRKFGLPDVTYTVKTKSDGFHFVYSLPVDSLVTIGEGEASGLGKGIDFRGNGGLLFAPPTDGYTVINPMEPVPATEALIKACSAKKAQTKSDNSSESFADIGTRNSKLFRHACSLRNNGLEQDELLIQILEKNSKLKEPLSETEILSLCASASKYDPLLRNEQEVLEYLKKDRTFIKFANGIYKKTESEGYIKSNQYEMQTHIHKLIPTIINRCHVLIQPSIQKIHFSEQVIRTFERQLTEYSDSPGKIVCKGKEIDMLTDLVTDAGETPLSTTVMPSRTDTPVWNQVLKNIFGDNPDTIEYIQRCIGCTISGSTKDEVFFILWGMGCNGKTTFLETIKGVLGESYAVNIESSVLVKKRFQSGTNYETARLHKKRLVLAPEASEGELDESLVKKMASTDTISARHIYGSPFSFVPTHKVWMTTNNKPQLRGNDRGITRRIKFIPFTLDVSHSPIENLNEKLKSEYSGILQWCIDGYKKYMEQGVGTSNVVEEATQEYICEQDPVRAFLNEMCVKDTEPSNESWRIKTNDFLKEYNNWADTHSQHFNRIQLPERLRKHGITATHTHDGNYYCGIHIKHSSKPIYGNSTPSVAPVGEFTTKNKVTENEDF